MNALRLLQIEDSIDDEKLVLREFKKNNYQVAHQCVQTAEALLEKLHSSSWDVIISDYNLPAFTGIEALRLVKTHHYDIPFIIVSGAIGEETAVEAMREGADDYLMKHNLHRLIPAVERAIREADNRRQRQLIEKEYDHIRLHMEGIISSAMDAIITVDENHNIVLFNQAAQELFGYASTDIIGKSLNQLLPERFQQMHDRHINEFGITGKTNRAMGKNMTIYGRNADGTEFPIEASISQIKVNQKSYYTVILRDITLRVKAEKQEKQLKLELISQNEQLQQFGYITSHNIRGPVATLLGLIDLFDVKQLENPQNKQIIDHISQTTQKLDIVIKDLNHILEYKQQVDAIKEKVSLKETTENVKTGIASLITTSKSIITYDFSKADELYTIKSYLHSIVHNLLSNAIKYRNPEKKSHINICSEIKEDTIYIHFKDNGLGIDLTRYKENLFGLYKRFHPQVEGKGLGLHLVKTQVNALNGKILVESQPGHGCLFSVLLPL